MEKVDASRIRAEYRLVEGCILGSNRLGFAALDVEAEREGFFICQTLFWLEGSWYAGPYFAAEAVSVAPGLRDPLELFVAGREGEMYELRGRTYTVHEPLQYADAGPLRRIRKLRNRILVLCEDRGVLEYDGREWRRLSRGLPEEPDFASSEDEGALLDRAIEESELAYGIVDLGDDGYCMTATGGEIWIWRDEAWTRDQSPTNVNLYDVMRTQSGELTVSGQLGTVLQGRPGAWQIVPTQVENDLLSVATSNGRVFFATGLDLLTFADDRLVIVDFGTTDPVPSHQVITGGGDIVSVAGKEVMHSTDGSRWAALL